jgi:hypothetical protein
VARAEGVLQPCRRWCVRAVGFGRPQNEPQLAAARQCFCLGAVCALETFAFNGGGVLESFAQVLRGVRAGAVRACSLCTVATCMICRDASDQAGSVLLAARLWRSWRS